MSYLTHFNLDDQPFRLTPDPDYLYWSKQHARAKAYMESTIWLADGFVVITGEIGSGKTTLLQSFLSELDDDVVYAVVSQTQLTATQFLQAVLTEFGFKPFNMRKVELLDMLNMFLIEQYSNGKKVVLIVDEAQNLSKKVLEEIRLMSGIETHKEKVLRIILAGQPEMREKLDSPGLKQLVQRVRLRFHVGPLDRRETREYIEHRLQVAGNENRDLFAAECFDKIHRYTGGVPRLINTLCDSALLCAFADARDEVTAQDVSSAIAELDWQEHENSTGVHEKLREIEQRDAQTTDVTRIEVRADGELIDDLSFEPGRVIVGRSPDNEIFIKSKFVSRHHAQLVSDDEGCFIEDLNSTNGVFLGEKQVKKYRLRDGDVVSVGVHELVYHDLRRSDEAGPVEPEAEGPDIDEPEGDEFDDGQPAEEELEQSMEDQPEQPAEDEPGQSMEDQPEQPTEDELEQSMEDQPEQPAEDELGQSMEDQPEQPTEDELEQSMEDQPEQPTEDELEQSMEDQLEQPPEDEFEQSMDDQLEQSMDDEMPIDEQETA